jgi:predicted dehydrogenase
LDIIKKKNKMIKNKQITGFIGAGGIARSHAFALNSMPFYYNDSPEIEKEAVCSATSESRDAFAGRFGFRYSLSPDEFFKNESIDTVFILGPNKVHYEHLNKAVNMPSVKRVYLEKPVCSTFEEEISLRRFAEEHKKVKVQIGFQFLFSSAVREALIFWKSGKLGIPVHFEIKYYHGDYLQKDYRARRKTRLTPAPDGGAMADLGSHVISMLIAFLGDKIKIVNALQAGSFNDVPRGSDLFSLITLYDPVSRSAGTLSASRISSGTGDLISFELYAEKGSLRYTTSSPDQFEYYSEETGIWHKQVTGSSYKPITTFPSGHVPSGWLRSMIHAHYVFFTGDDDKCFIPDLLHGLAVQCILRECSEQLEDFRNLFV